MNITLRQLYGFKAVADVGTFTAAAQRLKVAQPALSLNIRDLERELGARLFDRTRRRVVAAPPLLAALVVPGAVADFKKRFSSIGASVHRRPDQHHRREGAKRR